EHLYQRLVRAGKSHQFVAALYGILTVLVLSAFAASSRFNGIMPAFALFWMLVLSGGLAFYSLRNAG
ncbi:MAG TPA: hypothetical protein VK468_09320, partial [Pyrinomonadaceae bacterium]|nr:hypothetical protein [Pyrinomonadaceae bacterium]